MSGRNDPCWCGSGKKWKRCHYPSRGERSDWELLRRHYLKSYGIILKNRLQIEGIRAAGHLAARILDATCAQAKEGVTTEELDRFAQKLHEEAGALAAPLGYGSPPFPKSICTSLNEVICHGIPDKRPLKQGDILNIDITCILHGFYGDCSRMVCIGAVDEEKRRVVETSYECLMRSIAILKPNLPLSEIGKTIEAYALEQRCSVVYQFVGHGVGIQFHEDGLQIPHYTNQLSIPLAAGMTFTIEPMINAGSPEAVIDRGDRWTARTPDGKPSAQWEHTVLITEEGHEILTPWKR